MSKTTIQIPESTRNKLREERKPHESNYGDTIERLLNDGSGGQLWTEQELIDLMDNQIAQAQRHQ